ncbi:MAG: pilus assembly protein [Hyphomicrobiaceae bacterium]|nr:pilus assembly protein [Hyphomicrobiaceae bacterium]
MPSLPAFLSRASRDRSGAAAIVFALSAMLVLGGVGLSIDGARLYGVQHRLQQALDSAVLAAARRAATDGTTEQVEATFNSFFAATEVAQDIPIRSVVPDTSRPRRVWAGVVADVPMVLMPILGFRTAEVRAQSMAEFGFTRLEIALALDNTGSMEGAKLDALKQSALRLVDTLLSKGPGGDAVRFALVPFGQYVNVGVDRRGSTWLTVPPDDSSSTWNGCVGSRASPLNVQDSSYDARIPGIPNAFCPSPIQPLTSARSVLAAAIGDMVATGATYIPAGVMWGWRVLSTGEPFSESAGDRTAPDGDRINKILILMTDGANTRSATFPGHDGTDTEAANQHTATACANAKATGIGIYTIAFDVTDATVKAMLTSCASAPGRFFDASDSAQLDAAMQAIGQQLSSLRLSN